MLSTKQLHEQSLKKPKLVRSLAFVEEEARASGSGTESFGSENSSDRAFIDNSVSEDEWIPQGRAYPDDHYDNLRHDTFIDRRASLATTVPASALDPDDPHVSETEDDLAWSLFANGSDDELLRIFTDSESEEEEAPPPKRRKTGRPANAPAPKGCAGRHKSWVFTWNNYRGYQVVRRLKNIDCKYLVAGAEVGDSGTEHLQGLVMFKSEKSFKQVAGLLGDCFTEPCRTSFPAMEYCKKDGDIRVEFGEPPKKKGKDGNDGQKAKWSSVYELAKAGEVQRIGEENPKILIQCHRNLKEIAKEHQKKPAPLEGVCGYWLYGKSGAGKSRFARNKFPDAYKKPASKWWPFYAGEDVVTLEDLDPRNAHGLADNIKLWADEDAFIAEDKGAHVYIRPKIFIITSQYTPQEIWKDPKDVAAMTRRFHFMTFEQESWLDPQSRISPQWDDPRSVALNKKPMKPLFYPADSDDDL
ncbi:MAG TPA: hypothetical protein EYN66_16025 [Myxococcales bacterium]|nr:hypothetical protein [Myxococcales bacterium]